MCTHLLTSCAVNDGTNASCWRSSDRCRGCDIARILWFLEEFHRDQDVIDGAVRELSDKDDKDA